jgi:tetratricopeptide (TPR) repeat protein
MESKEILNKEKILEQARAFIDEGKFDKAIREYEKILLVDPSDLRVKLRIAELYTKRKQIQDAIRIYREVADSYATEGFYLKAVTVYKNILRLNPSLTEINEQLGSLYEKMGLTSDAIRQYDILATALDLRGEVEKVLELRSHIVRLSPDDRSARIRLAELYQREGRTPEAIDQYEEYARRLGDSGDDSGKMADLYEKILVHRPENQEMIRKLIMIYKEKGEHKKAIKWLENGKSFVEQDSDLLALHARICDEQNQHETAMAKYMLLVDLQVSAGNNDAALEALYNILVMLPDEEERIESRVNEIRPGALPELAARAQKRREQLEQEEIRRQNVAEGVEVAEHHEEPPAAKPAKKAKTEVKPEPKVEVQVPAKARDKKMGLVERKRADAAFDLGTMYLKMSLSSEARAEFAKAQGIYDALIEQGGGDNVIKERLSYILSAVGSGMNTSPKVEARDEIKVEVKVKEQPKPKAESQSQPKPQPEVVVGKKKAKKKISFV